MYLSKSRHGVGREVILVKFLHQYNSLFLFETVCFKKQLRRKIFYNYSPVVLIKLPKGILRQLHNLTVVALFMKMKQNMTEWSC